MVWTKYSSTPSSNTASPPDGAPENMAANTVNNIQRDQMAEIRILGDYTSGAWADIASATTTNIGAAGVAHLRVTGTTTITAFDTVTSGFWRRLRFAGILTLTHNGTSLILPGAANITTAAGDTCDVVSLGSGNWICTQYTRVTGIMLLGSTGSGNIVRATTPTITNPNVVGTSTNDDASALNIGEVISSTVAVGSAVALTSTTAKQVTNISLTAGDWDVWGQVEFTGNAATTLVYTGGQISSTNNSVADTQSAYVFLPMGGGTVFAATNPVSFSLGTIRLSLAGTTIYYLNAVASFAVNTCSAYGGIYARRRR